MPKVKTGKLELFQKVYCESRVFDSVEESVCKALKATFPEALEMTLSEITRELLNELGFSIRKITRVRW